MQIDKSTMQKSAGPAFVFLGVIFMTTINIALGASFLAIGAALIAKDKKDQGDAENSEGDAQ